MLRNLLKYEFKATARMFIPLYIALILVSIVNRIFRMSSIDMGFTLTVMTLVGLFIALGVMTLIGVIDRFKKNLLSDEGYLMFTLPVSSKQLIGSKLIITLIWTTISAIVAVLAFTILLADQYTFIELHRVFTELVNIWRMYDDRIQMWVFVQIPLLGIMTYISFILVIYLSLASAQLPKFNKYRTLMSFICFFVISTIIQWVGVILSKFIEPLVDIHNTSQVITMITMVLFANIVLNIGLFLGTDFILRKHLNLE